MGLLKGDGGSQRQRGQTRSNATLNQIGNRLRYLAHQRKRHKVMRKKRDGMHQNRETRQLRIDACAKGEEDDAIPTSDDFSCKNEHGEGISEALGEK